MGERHTEVSEESFFLTLGMILHLLSEGTISNIPVPETMIKSTFSFDPLKQECKLTKKSTGASSFTPQK